MIKVLSNILSIYFCRIYIDKRIDAEYEINTRRETLIQVHIRYKSKYKKLVYCRYRKRSLTFQAYSLMKGLCSKR